MHPPYTACCNFAVRSVGMISEKKFTNQMIQAFKGGAVYTNGKRVGQVKEHDILWEGGDGAIKGFGC
jgi:hypothetical protein